MLGLVCFTCPGLYNAMTGLGGGGQISATTSANANTALYAIFGFFAFFSGSITNVLGPRLTLFLGTTGYVLGLGSYLAMNIHPNAAWFVITAGAIQGVCAGLLWTAQGSLMMAYPTDAQRGKSISVVWTIYNLGGVVGAAVSLGENIHLKVFGNGTYIGLIVLNALGMAVPLLMVDPQKMIRSDGTKVTTPRQPTWKSEFYGLYYTLKTDPMVLFLFPSFFASIWYYTWQFNDYNAALFNIRARSLNNLVYWIAQILGAVAIGFFLDQQWLSRRFRAFSGWVILLFLVFLVHSWAFVYQRQYTRQSIPPDSVKMDIYDKGYPAKILLYMFCGALDAIWQTAFYWVLGTMSSDPGKLAHFAGFYKSIQSAGVAGAFRADAVGIPYMNIFLAMWCLLVVGLLFALPMFYLRVENSPLPDASEHSQYVATHRIADFRASR
ncbi:MFS general substrate transporter [Gloeophyllum trabeum ATCC 11539]|uniref:MFS general substrate transporter n=1 Tax=Gloeophyllum trabeum (strain ATCC 11539 / FP-39264 / Madison 617) TaxID=670483 RepID=S7Q2C0_GLOTA|nr:MFS general substrate transporter [Gloeophyllum trabeum ATCC 11539]EPQ53697.1 MFS general substrate transporter [Gloeophyllum trabeum ATCC 11539]